jgi:dienelactone hydrolase
VVLGLAIALTACVNRRVVTPLSPGGELSPTQVDLGPFDYERAPLPLRNHDLEPRGDYDVKQLSFPSSGENGQADNRVTARYYRGRVEGRKPLVIVLPIWGSRHLYPARKMTRVLRSRFDGDANVMHIDGHERLVDFDEIGRAEDVVTFRATIARMSEQCRNSVIDIRRILDWAESQSDIDPERIALIGFSIGAIIAADAALVDPRFAATVLVMGSADPARVIAFAEGAAQRNRELILERFGWTQERYHQELEAAFGFLDPARMGGRVDPARVLIFDAARDEKMPLSTRDALWEAMGRPERITLQYKHGFAFFSMSPLGKSYTTDRIVRFLEETL